jgi:hypothetical protein
MNKYDFLSKISSSEITFMKDLGDCLTVTPMSKYKYFNMYCFETLPIRDFINILDEDQIYILIPFISMDGKLDDPYLILSRQILVTQYSNIYVIQGYLHKQYLKSKDHFNLYELEDYKCYFKYRKVDITRNSSFK